MAMLPLMPSPGGPVDTPSPGPPPPVGGAMPTGQEQMGLLGAAGGQGMAGGTDPAALSAITTSALRQFDQIQQMILDLAQAFPGNEDAARQMMEGLERWRQGIVVSMAPPPAMMPGAQQMM